MDDLAGLDWNSSNDSAKRQATAPALSFPTLQPTSPPTSGRSTPAAFQSLSVKATPPRSALSGSSKPSIPANDSFASLLSTNVNKGVGNLSIHERQRQLAEAKSRQEQEQRKELEGQYGGQHGTFWDGLGQNGSGTPTGTYTPAGANSFNKPITRDLSGVINRPFVPLSSGRIGAEIPDGMDEEDLLAAFNSKAPVDASSHFPPSSSFGSVRTTAENPFGAKTVNGASLMSNNGGFDFGDDDDDPFGLGKIARNPATFTSKGASESVDGDAILGMLAKPLSEMPRNKLRSERQTPSSEMESLSTEEDHPQSKAVAELVDMGFPANKSAHALAQTDTGVNVQAAVGILLNQAHEEAKQKSNGKQGPKQSTGSRAAGVGQTRQHRGGREDLATPAWMQADQDRARSRSRNQDNRSPAGEKDLAKQAQDIGSTLFKSANTLWKTGQKKVQRVVNDLQQESDSSQPKWMKDAQAQETASRSSGKTPQRDVTDEAMALEHGNGRPHNPSRRAQSRPVQTSIPDEGSRTQSLASNSFQDELRQQRSQRGEQQVPGRPIGRVSRQQVETEAEEAYVSSHRRRTTPKPAESSSATPQVEFQNSRSFLSSPDALSQSSARTVSKPTSPAPAKKAQPATLPPRPKAQTRQVPPVSALALSNSSSQRSKGSEAFKRGDYSSAHAHYTSALQGIPHSHPITIVILSNRALTNLKVGDPRAALSDAESALSTIGVSRGEGEKIGLSGGEGEKEMREFFGKALMRKAEALENLERWGDAGKVWREAVEGGVGGAVSTQGRTRCEKAAGAGTAQQSRAPAATVAKRVAPQRPKASALSDLSYRPSAASATAVKKLREANAQAEKNDDEKFALTDKVDALLAEWKGTKADNLRALLGSVDKVLWPEAGWKKIGMQDLVLPAKVKINYMKAIAKVHPDKISPTATTEQRMISASVFSTLNEAWDKFKTDNGM